MNKNICQLIICSGISAMTVAGYANSQVTLPTLKPTTETVTQRQLNDQSLLAINWMQQSGEYRALAYQAYNSAQLAFDNAKKVKNPVVIVDIDETVLDNSAYQSGLINTDTAFSTESWNQWIKAKKAKAVPGAVEFVNYVNANGGKVFFISDRDESSTGDSKNNDLELATIANLKAVGFTGVNEQGLLLKGEFTQTVNGKKDTNKQFRREAVENGKADGKVHTTVILVGDNLNDLDAVAGKTNSARRLHVDNSKNLYGVKGSNSQTKAFKPTYIVLPNPMYGSWESGLYTPTVFGKKQWSELNPTQKNQQRKQVLNRWISN